jgi:hypothetical protein
MSASDADVRAGLPVYKPSSYEILVKGETQDLLDVLNVHESFVYLSTEYGL